MDKFWIRQLEGGWTFEVEIPGWVIFPRGQLEHALIQIQRDNPSRVITGVTRVSGFNHYYLVFTLPKT
jgi:hypothetical protein